MQYVYQLFFEKSLDNIIEVFDCYDSMYGNIFYNGQLIENFYKESYVDSLESYKVINKMKKMGLDLDKAQVVVYDLQPLRDYQDDMEVHDEDNDNLDFELAVDYDYHHLLHTFSTNFDSLQQVIEKAKAHNSYYKFVQISNLDLE